MAKRLAPCLCFILLIGINSILGTSYVNNGDTLNNSFVIQAQKSGIQLDSLQAVTNDTIHWMQTYNGNLEDSAWSVIQTSDDGFALCGSAGAHGNYTAWLIKTDSFGNVQWTQTYNFSHARAVISTTDGGYALAGTWKDVIRDDSDAWLVKTNDQGDIQWTRIFDLAIQDEAQSLIQTNDDGIVMGGYSFGDASNSDAWLVKYDVNGNREWIQFYRGAAHEQLNKMIQTDENEFVFVGSTDSSGEGFNDVWFVKTNDQGKRVWTHTYGGSGYDTAYDVIQTTDGFAIIGATSSFGAGNFDAWLVKTDSAGNIQWNQTYGRSTYNSAYSGIQTIDGGYLLAGITKTFRTFTDDMDLWLLKIDGSGQLQWNQTYGGDQDDEAYSIIQTADNGFAIAGRTLSYDAARWDAWLIKTDSFGVVPDIEVHRFSRFEIVLMVGLTIIAIGSFGYYVKHWRSRRSRWRNKKTKPFAEESLGIIRKLPHEAMSSEIAQKSSTLDPQKESKRKFR